MPDEERPVSAEVDDAATVEDGAAGKPAVTKPAVKKPVVKAAEKPVEKPAKKPAAKKPAAKPGTEKPAGPLFSPYGLVSAFLGLVSVAALVFGLITWSHHHSDTEERAYRGRVLQAAATWTTVLINLNAENVEKGMQRLRDKSVGELNTEFDAALTPYREVVQRIQSRSSGRVEAVAIESVHRDPGNADAGWTVKDSSLGRTDPVMVIATSVAENVDGHPQTVHWVLHLDITEVDGKMLVSRLRSIR